jgi:hypothetical protein
VVAAPAGGTDGHYRCRRGTDLLCLPGDPRYLHFAWRLFRYALIVALLVFALLILERVAVIPL